MCPKGCACALGVYCIVVCVPRSKTHSCSPPRHPAPHQRRGLGAEGAQCVYTHHDTSITTLHLNSQSQYQSQHQYINHIIQHQSQTLTSLTTSINNIKNKSLFSPAKYVQQSSNDSPQKHSNRITSSTAPSQKRALTLAESISSG